MEDLGRKDIGDFGDSGLLQEIRVWRHSELGSWRSLGTTVLARSHVLRSDITSCFTVAGFDGLAVETQELKGQRVFWVGPYISMSLKAKKPSSRKIYYRTWRSNVS